MAWIISDNGEAADEVFFGDRAVAVDALIGATGSEQEGASRRRR